MRLKANSSIRCCAKDCHGGDGPTKAADKLQDYIENEADKDPTVANIYDLIFILGVVGLAIFGVSAGSSETVPSGTMTVAGILCFSAHSFTFLNWVN